MTSNPEVLKRQIEELQEKLRALKIQQPQSNNQQPLHFDNARGRVERPSPLLDNYLCSLIDQYGLLYSGKLLPDEQPGRSAMLHPSFLLHRVYTSLATNYWVPAPDGAFDELSPQSVLAQMDAGDPRLVLPDKVRLPVLRHADESDSTLYPLLRSTADTIDQEWKYTRHRIEAGTGQPPDGRLSGRWYRPELAVQAILRYPRLVLLGSAGSGKSTVLHYLVVILAELLRAGTSIPHLPVPLFCSLGQVAKELSDNPDDDATVLLNALIGSVEGIARLREGIHSMLLSAWHWGGVLLCLDGLDEVPDVSLPARGGSQSLRERMVAAILHLVDQLGKSRIVLTCRTQPYLQDTVGHFREPWVVRILQPLALGQMRHFVSTWYNQSCSTPQPGYTTKESMVRAERLIATLEQYKSLHAFIASPLLLTMLILLDYNEQRIPEQRVAVYESLLLLNHWEAVRSSNKSQRMVSFADRVGVPHLTINDLRPVINEIAFATYVQGDNGSGLVSREAINRILDSFFARKLNPTAPHRVPRSACARCSEGVITLLVEETELIHYTADGRYVLTYPIFAEYLAACHLAAQEDAEQIYRLWATAPERWREVILLMLERLLHQEQYETVYTLLTLLVAERCGETAKTVEQRHRDALFALACYEALGQRTYLAARLFDIVRFEQDIQAALAALLEQSAVSLRLPQRLELGHSLAAFGDPRYPITHEEWEASIYGLSPTILDSSRIAYYLSRLQRYWCFIHPGSYRIGGWEKGAASANISLPTCWLARYPITVAQYQMFIAAGGYGQEAERWWTPKGWAWKQTFKQQSPWKWHETGYTSANQALIGVGWYEAMAFCAWLTEQMRNILPRGYSIRLPTEAEWEAAAAYDRRGQRRMYPWGEEAPTLERAIYDESGLGTPAPVGLCSSGAAACGAFDMAGNVWEWTLSSYGGYPQESSTRRMDFATNEYDVPLRGGAWINDEASTRCAARVWGDPNFFGTTDGIGFRVMVAPRLSNEKAPPEGAIAFDRSQSRKDTTT